MALDFPASPTAGQLFNGYVWDGQKWAKSSEGDAHVAALPPSLPLTGDLWWNSSTGVLSVWTGSSWAVVSDPGGVFTGGAGLEALAYSGMQINGSMEVSQELGENNGVSIAGGSSRHIADGWKVISSGSQVVIGTDILTTAVPGLRCALEVTVTTANASPGGGDYITITQLIEGYRIARLAWGSGGAGQPVALAFHIQTSRAGTYSGSIRNSAKNQSYAFSISIGTAGVWSYVTVVIPPSLSGAWLNTNGVGLDLSFTMMAGSTLIATAPDAWATGNFLGVPGTVNGVASIGDYVRMTGVVLISGIQAPTPLQLPLMVRSFGQELTTCMRYYEKNLPYSQIVAANAAKPYPIWGPIPYQMNYLNFTFNVEKRATPVVTTYPFVTPANTGRATAGDIVDYPANSASPGLVHAKGFSIQNATGSPLVAVLSTIYVGWYADARL
jgi:hypothetical protein